MVFQQVSHSDSVPKFASTVSVESTHSCGKSSSEGFNAMVSHDMELSSSDWPNRPHPLPLLEMLEPSADENRESKY